MFDARTVLYVPNVWRVLKVNVYIPGRVPI